MNSKKNSRVATLRVVVTSPLSFDVTVGEVLRIRQFEPSSHNRPTVSGGFKTIAFLVFDGITKVGRLKPNDVNSLGRPVPEECTVVEVDRTRKMLKIQLRY